MKRLAVLMMIPALAMFIAPALASADGHQSWGIHGTYAMTGTGNCLWAGGGFTSFNPDDPWYLSLSTYPGLFSAQGIWVFKQDGTGSAQFTHFGLSVPAVASPFKGVTASMYYLFDFAYRFNDDGTITIEMVVPDPTNPYQGKFLTGPNIGRQFTLDTFTFSGMISTDHKTLTLTTKNELQYYTFNPSSETLGNSCFAVCNSSRVLIRVK